MRKNKTPLSKSSTYKKIGEFWDTHDLAEVWEKTKSVDFEIDIQSQCRYYPVEISLSGKLTELAKKQGISPETLLNLWIKEKIQQSDK